MMDKSKIRPLKSIELRSRPLTGHCLAWSCDAELAVATDDVIYIFLPEYPKAGRSSEGGEDESSQHQFSLSMRASGMIRPDPNINGQICALQGIKIPVLRPGDENWFTGVGNGLVTGSGASVSQMIRLEWSPNGLGCNQRPILTALSTNGAIFALGENIDPQSTVISGMRTRSFKAWKTLWGLGAQMPIPDASTEEGYRMVNDRIQSFSWAKEVSGGRALLAYMTDREEVVIMSIQLANRSKSAVNAAEEQSRWEFQELGRFDGSGLHTREDATDITDPDFVPHGSPFSLKWSPWHTQGGNKTAVLAYLAKNYVGFRKITIQGNWAKGDLPKIDIATTDTTSICAFMLNDAVIEWESAISMDEGTPVARGVIGTPYEVKPFQVSLNEDPRTPLDAHYTWECSTTYARDNEGLSTNPITGLAIHPRDRKKESSVPHYSLVRLSATANNQDWYQSNLPEADTSIPQWAEVLKRRTGLLVSRAAALEGIESDSDDSDDEMMEDDGSKLQVHPTRFRIWGMALSPGGGATAAVISRHSTLHPQRRGLSKLVFGWREQGSDELQLPLPDKSLTTEGQLWEWMYGGGPEVLETSGFVRALVQATQSPLREQFKEVISKQRCVFCDGVLQPHGEEVRCENAHVFARCAATGLAILAPDISRICAVCELRCLKVSELTKIAEEHLSPGTVVESSGEVCGGCGGKFVA